MSLSACRVRSIRQRVINHRDRRSLRFLLWRNLSVSMAIGVVLTLVIFAMPIYLQGGDPVELVADVLQRQQQPTLAFEQRYLTIEPAAPPLDHDEMIQFCRRALAKEPRCEW